MALISEYRNGVVTEFVGLGFWWGALFLLALVSAVILGAFLMPFLFPGIAGSLLLVRRKPLIAVDWGGISLAFDFLKWTETSEVFVFISYSGWKNPQGDANLATIARGKTSSSIEWQKMFSFRCKKLSEFAGYGLERVFSKEELQNGFFVGAFDYSANLSKTLEEIKVRFSDELKKNKITTGKRRLVQVPSASAA